MFPRDSDYDYSNTRMVLVKLNKDLLEEGIEYIKGNKTP